MVDSGTKLYRDLLLSCQQEEIDPLLWKPSEKENERDRVNGQFKLDNIFRCMGLIGNMSSPDFRGSMDNKLEIENPDYDEVEIAKSTASGDVKKCSTVLDPQGKLYISWLMVVTVAYTYNSWVLPLRCCFPYQTEENVSKWIIFDYIADFIYLIDLILVKSRVMYLNDGFWIHDFYLTRTMYTTKCQFKMDLLSLLPLDALCFIYGSKWLPFFRLPRLLKIQTFWEFYNRCDRVVSSAYVVRVARTLTYMLYLVHLNACAYYIVSRWEGLGTNNWVFNGKGNAYIRCFYFATKTATSIGKNPKPENQTEYIFMTCSWLMGVFVFALLIGQIRDIIATATRNQTEYRKLVDETMEYMRRLSLPKNLQERVKLWFKYTWEQQHTFNEGVILDTLPHKLKTDVAINVHIQSLSKVQIFQDCDPALLRELVLKLQPVLFLPRDLICRKGEVGKEMYIVKAGVVEVLGDDENEVLATLREGSVFGEISLLSLGSGNRRTASVRSGGYSNLFVLSKADLNEALVHYPDAQEILKNKAKMLVKENAERERLNKLREQEALERSGDITEDDSDDSDGDFDTTSQHTLTNQLGKIVASSWLQGITSLATLATQEPLLSSRLPGTAKCEATVHREQ